MGDPDRDPDHRPGWRARSGAMVILAWLGISLTAWLVIILLVILIIFLARRF